MAFTMPIPRVSAALLRLLRWRWIRRAKPPQMVSLYLWGTPNLHVRIPLAEIQEHMGVDGYHVRATPPVRALFTGGGGIFFGLTLGYYAFLFFGHSISQALTWGGVGLVIGGMPGFMVGTLFKRLWTAAVYTAWTRWDEGERLIIPMEHISAAQMMSQSSKEHRAATLARIGELPMRRGPQRFGQEGGEAEMEPVVDSAMTANVVATYSPQRLYTMMQGRLWERVMQVRRKGDHMVQVVSLGTIAVSMLVVVALIVLVFAEPSVAPTGVQSEGSSPPAASPNQGFSNAK